MMLSPGTRSTRPLKGVVVLMAAAALAGAGAGTVLGFWTGGSGELHYGAGQAIASSVNQGATPTVSAQSNSTVIVNWSATTMSDGGPVAGYQVKRYDATTSAPQTILSSCTGTITATTCTESGVPAGAWKYTVTPVVGANWRGAESAKSSTVNVDITSPTHALSLTAPVGAFRNGSGTLYYKGNAAGSFRLVDALADAGSGPASVTYPAVTATGWTHANETVSTPAGGPYTSSTFSWTAGAANPTGYSITGRDNVNNSSSIGLTFVSDITAPSGGSVSYTNGMVYRTSVPVTTANGTDTQSGVNASTGTITRAQATLNTTTQTCGAFGGFTTTVTLVGGNDTSVVSGNCYQYHYAVLDNVGNRATYTSTSIAKVDATPYPSVVLANAGLVNYWRLGESTITTDTFTGTAGTSLSSRSGEIGATWSTYGSPTTTAVLSNENRARRNGTGFAMYTASGTPPTADYSIQADINVKSVLSQDAIGLTARTTAGENFYLARLVVNGATQQWELLKVVNGTATTIASTPVVLAAGQTHTLKLSVVGTLLTMWANGSQIASLNDGTLTATGRPGLRFGFGGATGVPTNTAGLHADNFNATPMADDSKGTANGNYWGATALSQTGAISGDSNTAALFDGVNDHVTAARQIGDDFSIEFWFKSTQGLGTNAQWWGNAGLVDADVGGAANDFGISLRSDGRVVAGTGTPDISIVSPIGTAYNNGQWHHVVFTRTRATGAMALYIDGVSRGTATGTANTTLNSPPTIYLGRIATGGNYFAGTLDEVATYSTVLSQATISDHYARR